MAYNTKLVKKADASKSYQDLLLPGWKGKIGMEQDLAELFAALIPIWGRDAMVNYFKALRKQERIAATRPIPVRPVARSR